MNVKQSFRRALFSCTVAFGVASSLNAQRNYTAADSTTQLVITPVTEGASASYAPWTGFNTRQDEYLVSDSLIGGYADWQNQLDTAANFDLMEKALFVNTLVNKKVTWTSDSLSYGQADYWAPAAQTILSGKGDCDDYAVAKYDALRYLGVDSSRLVILTVAAYYPLSSEVNHAVLAVDTSENNDWTDPLILDNIVRHEKDFDHTGYLPSQAITPDSLRTCTMQKILKPPSIPFMKR